MSSDLKHLMSLNVNRLTLDQSAILIKSLEQMIIIENKVGKFDHDCVDSVKQKIIHLKEACKHYLYLRFKSKDIIFKMNLLFPSYISGQPEETLYIHAGPIDYVPYSVYYFVHMIDNWKHAVIHRNAGHVKQFKVDGDFQPMAFQEYHEAFPHIEYSLGFAGRPGGPAFYISTRDNSVNHGPGSQGSKTGQADGCFGIIYDEGSKLVVERIKQMRGMGNAGFIGDKDNCVKVVSVGFD